MSILGLVAGVPAAARAQEPEPPAPAPTAVESTVAEPPAPPAEEPAAPVEEARPPVVPDFAPPGLIDRSGEHPSALDAALDPAGALLAGLEIRSLRDEHSRTFATGEEGVYVTATYQEPVHYEAPDGTLRSYDTRLEIEGGAGEDVIETRSTPLDVAIAEDAATDELVSVSDGGASIAFDLAGARTVDADVAGREVTFEDIRPATDLVIEPLRSGVKETLVLADASAPRVFDFPLDLDGLVAELDAEGNVLYRGADGSVRALTPRGWMEDSDVDDRTGRGAMTDAVVYELLGTPDAPVLRVRADDKWLDAPGRVWPVRLDPTTNWIYADGDDTYASTGYGQTFDYSYYDHFHTGTYDSGSHVRRAYLHFGGLGALTGKVIHSANLWLYNVHTYACNTTGSTADQWITDAYRVTAPWDGRATPIRTWATRPPSGDWIGWTNTGTGHASYCPTDGWATLNVLGAVQMWTKTSGGWPNYGVEVRARLENHNYGSRQWSSSETGTPPQLIVEWSDPVPPAPATPAMVSPANNAATSGALTLSARNTDSRAAHIGFQVFLPNGALDQWIWCNNSTAVAPGATCSVAYVPPGTTEGSFRWITFAYIAGTASNGYSPVSADRYFVVDRTPPTLTGVTGWPSAVGDGWRPWGSNYVLFTANDTSGINAFSYTWNQSPTTNPDSTPEYAGICLHPSTDNAHDWYVAVPGFPASCDLAAAGNAADGTWYLHVKARNGANLWGPAIHVRHQFDRTAPTQPGAPQPACAAAAGSGARVVLSWGASTDVTSGLRGYSWVWNNSASTAADTVTTEGGPTTTSTTSPALANGTWYFHLRALDNATSSLDGSSNGSTERVFGPVTVANGQVTNVTTSRFVNLWHPRVTDESFWATWNSTPGVPGPILDEGFHSLPAAEQRQLVDCLVTAIATSAGTTVSGPERDAAVDALADFIFDKAAVDEVMAPYLEPGLDDGDVAALPAPEDDPLVADALAHLAALRDLLPDLVDRILDGLPDDLLGRLAETLPVEEVLDLPDEVVTLLTDADLEAFVQEQVQEVLDVVARTRSQLEQLTAQVTTLGVDGWLPAVAPQGVGFDVVAEMTTEYVARLGTALSSSTLRELLNGAEEVEALAGGLLADSLQALEDAGGIDVPSPLYSLCGTNAAGATRCADVPIVAINPFDSDGDGNVDVLAQLTLGPCDLNQILDLENLLEIVTGIVRPSPSNPLQLPLSFCVRPAPGVSAASVHSHVFFDYDVPLLEASASFGFDGRTAGLGSTNAAQFRVERINSFRDAAGDLDLDFVDAPASMGLSVALAELDVPEGQVADELVGRIDLQDVPAELGADFDVDLDGPGPATAVLTAESSASTAVGMQFRSVDGNVEDSTSNVATLTAILDRLPATRVSVNALFDGPNSSADITAAQPVSIARAAFVGVIAPSLPSPDTVELALDVRNLQASAVDVDLMAGKHLRYRATGALGLPAPPFGPVTAAATVRDGEGVRYHAYAHASQLPAAADVVLGGTIPTNLADATGSLVADFSSGLPDVDGVLYARDLGGDPVELMAALEATGVPRHLAATFDAADRTATFDAREPNVQPPTAVASATLLASFGDVDLGAVQAAATASDTLGLAVREDGIGVAATVTNISTATASVTPTGTRPSLDATITTGNPAANRPLLALVDVDTDADTPGRQLGMAYIDRLPQSVAVSAAVDLTAGTMVGSAHGSAGLAALDALYLDTAAGLGAAVTATGIPANIDLTAGLDSGPQELHGAVEGTFRGVDGITSQGVESLAFEGILHAGTADEAAARGAAVGLPGTIDLDVDLAGNDAALEWAADGPTEALTFDARFATDYLFGVEQILNVGLDVLSLPSTATLAADGDEYQLAVETSATTGPLSAYLTTGDMRQVIDPYHALFVYRPAERRLELSVRAPSFRRALLELAPCGTTRPDGRPAACPGAARTYAGALATADLGGPAPILVVDVDIETAGGFIARASVGVLGVPSAVGIYLGNDGFVMTSTATGAGLAVVDGVIGAGAAVRSIPSVPASGDPLAPMADTDRLIGIAAADGVAGCGANGCQLGFLARGILPTIPTLARLDVATRQFDLQLAAGSGQVPILQADLALPNLPRYLSGSLALPLVAEASVIGLPPGLDLSLRLDQLVVNGFEDSRVELSARSNLPIGYVGVVGDVDISSVAAPVGLQARPEGHEVDWLDEPVAPDEDGARPALVVALEVSPVPAVAAMPDGQPRRIASMRLGDDPVSETVEEVARVETTLTGALDFIDVEVGIATAAQFAAHAAGDVEWLDEVVWLVDGNVEHLAAGTNTMTVELQEFDAPVTAGTCTNRTKLDFPALRAEFAGAQTDGDIELLEPLFRTSLWTRLAGSGVADRLRPTEDVVVSWLASPRRWRTYAGGREDPIPAEDARPEPTSEDPYGNDARIGVRVLDDQGAPSVTDGQFGHFELQTSLLAKFEAVVGFTCGDLDIPYFDIEGAALELTFEPMFLRDLTVVVDGLRSMTMLLPHGPTLQVGGDFDFMGFAFADASYRMNVRYPGLEIYFKPLDGLPLISNTVRIPLLEILELSGLPLFEETAQWLSSPHDFDARRIDFDVPVLLASDEPFEIGPQLWCGISLRPWPRDWFGNGALLGNPQDLGHNHRHVLTISPPLPGVGSDESVFYLSPAGTQILSMFFNHTGSSIIGC